MVCDVARAKLAVFDAPLNAFATAERFAVKHGYTIEGLYCTHGHWDHILDGWRFAEAGVPVYAHAGDRMFYETPGSMSAFAIPGLEMRSLAVSHWLEAGVRIDILGESVDVRAVPGHSGGSVLFWFEQSGFAVSGDAIFHGSVGRTDFPGCSFAELEQSIRTQIYTLPDNTVLYPGHGPQTTVGHEAVSNPFVRRR